MTLDKHIDVLRKVELFRDFGREQLRLLAFSSEVRLLSDHSVLFDKGFRAEGGFVVLEGVIARVAKTAMGPRIIDRLKPGSLIDEFALVTPMERSGKAIAIGSSSVLLIRRALFQRLISEHTHLAASIQLTWSERLRSTTRDLTTMLPVFETEGQTFGRPPDDDELT